MVPGLSTVYSLNLSRACYREELSLAYPCWLHVKQTPSFLLNYRLLFQSEALQIIIIATAKTRSRSLSASLAPNCTNSSHEKFKCCSELRKKALLFCLFSYSLLLFSKRQSIFYVFIFSFYNLARSSFLKEKLTQNYFGFCFRFYYFYFLFSPPSFTNSSITSKLNPASAWK